VKGLLASVLACAACGGSSGDPTPELPAWDKTLPEASLMGAWRGLIPTRGIVHLHSPYSHDACDGNPRATDGTPNEPCLQDLRAGLCQTHIDFAALTDHDASMADEEFTTLFSMRGGDVAVTNATGDQIASRMTCDDGHVVTFTVGSENELMPIMLERHVAAATVQERHDIYNASDLAAADAYRAAGGLAWVAHTESKTLDELRMSDGFEVYNLHANIDPNIRPEYLGLDAGGAIAAAAEFADTNPGHPEPDLALLAFLTPNEPAIDKWQTLLGEGQHVPVTAGSDAHENALPITLADGERGDSYRRVLRWFGNIALVADPLDPLQVKDAMRRGRLFALFEVLGTPDGFDVHATGPSATYELGDTIPVAEGADLSVSIPTIRGLDPSLPVPSVRARVLRIAPGGSVTEVANVADEPSLVVHVADPGAYRVEITIVPRHLGPYLGDLGPAAAEAELPWIYASPIYVE